MKMKKFWPRGGVHIPGTPLLRSATDYDPWLTQPPTIAAPTETTRAPTVTSTTHYEPWLTQSELKSFLVNNELNLKEEGKDNSRCMYCLLVNHF